MAIAFAFVTKESRSQRAQANETTVSALAQKTLSQQILENSFNARVSAIYALYDSSAFQNLDIAVNQEFDQSRVLLNQLSQTAAL
ncbi:hypothetical protein LRP52_37635, partial [Photobacterium sp. ZSDE20]|nr:hypothetical protein [Photobacterium sp. ZSDE20]